MPVNWKRALRKVHYWCSIITAVPFLLILLSGLLLQVKKQVSWVQPDTMTGQGDSPEIPFSKVLEIARTVPEARIETWEDVARLDVRPDKGIIKIRSKNNWEAQIDHQTGEILQFAYRRSDIIESIHDGSFFHPKAKPWLFTSFGVGLLLLAGTGVYLFVLPYTAKRKSRSGSGA